MSPESVILDDREDQEQEKQKSLPVFHQKKTTARAAGRLMVAVSIINDGITAFKFAIGYLQANAWYILIMLAIGYAVKTNYVDAYLTNQQYRVGSKRVADYREDMRRVRLAQQEVANQRAVEAAKLRKENESERKNEKAKKTKPQQRGDRLGRTNDNSYNPMQPWSSGSGGGYKATRRTVRRG